MLNHFAHDPSLWVYVVAVIMLAVMPLLFRYSRAVMLYSFGGAHFDPRYLSR